MGVNGFGGGVQMVVGVSKQVWVSFVCVKLGIQTEMSGLKLCEALASVRGRSTSSDVSSDISPSPLYIPPRRQPKTECTRSSDTGVR